MAKVKQPYPEERFVPWIGTNVPPGAVVEVPDGDLPSYLEAGWEPGDPATKKAAAEIAKARAVAELVASGMTVEEATKMVKES
jgi:hypothetical protein